ncbi:MAG: hypothetical protein ACLFS4_05240 [Opitutales bacterium]
MNQHPLVSSQRERWIAPLALLIAVLVHLWIYLLLPDELFPGKPGQEPEADPLEVVLEPPEKVEPEEMRYVEANPEVPENEPDPTEQYSFRDQQAADREAADDGEDRPRVEGETDSQKIVQGSVEDPEPLPPGVYRPEERAAEETEAREAEEEEAGERPGQPAESEGTEQASESEAPEVALRQPAADWIQQEPVEEEGPGSRPEEPGPLEKISPDPDPDAPIPVYQQEEKPDAESDSAPSGEGSSGEEARPQPRERPRLSPELVQGPRMRSQSSARQRGQLAIDATFSEFGEYQRQFFAAVQAGWYKEIGFFQPMDTDARVHLRFTMKADGSVHDLEVVRSNASEVGTVICETAISKRSPFRPWTREMVKVFGRQRTMNVVFYYR